MDDDNILPSDVIITTECDRCGLYEHDEDIVIIEEENLCEDCAEYGRTLRAWPRVG